MTKSMGLVTVALACVASPALAQSSEQARDPSERSSGLPSNRSESTSADEPAERLSGQIGVSFVYDSNVAADDIDLNSGRGDLAAEIGARVAYEAQVARSTTVQFGYRFSQRLYEEFTRFDLQSHSGLVLLEHDFGPVDLDLGYRFVHASLGGAGFLSIHRLSPSVSFYAADRVLVRVEYALSEKDFVDRTDRDASKHALGADVYWLVQGAKTFLVTGYRFEDENARDGQFDYTSQQVRLRLAQRFRLASRRAQARLEWRYEDRDYSEETLTIGAERRDRRHRASAEIRWDITPNLELAAEYSYSDFVSNLPAADSVQSLVRIGSVYRF